MRGVSESPLLAHQRSAVIAGLTSTGVSHVHEVWCEIPVEIAQKRRDDVRPLDRAMPDLWKDWELRNLYELDTPDVAIRTAELDNGRILMWLFGNDGSWARAESDGNTGRVHQAGTRRLWDDLERVEQRWETAGRFPLHSLTVRLTPDGGTLTASDGTWTFAI